MSPIGSSSREAFTAETNRLRGAASARIAERARELAGISTAIERLVRGIVDGAPARAVTKRIQALEARRSDLEAFPRRNKSWGIPI